MKRTSSKRGTSTRLLLAAGMLAAPALTALAQTDVKQPMAKATSQKDLTLNFAKISVEYKMAGQVDIVGEEGAHTIYKNARGQTFFLDPKTGDQKFVQAIDYLKVEFPGKVTLLGVNAQGNTIQQNAKGEKFYLNPHGDMIPVK